MELLPFQRKAVNEALAYMRDGKTRVCLVAPTGAGKTIIGLEVARRARASQASVLWCVHRTGLVDQLHKRTLDYLGTTEGVRCETIQSMLRNGFPEHELLVLDECHHYAADEWKAVTKLEKRTLGLTATPERADGRPLGNLFDALVIAAQYPQLVGLGRLVDAVVERPPHYLGSDLSIEPALAYELYGQEKSGIVFCRDIKHAERVAAQLPDAAAIHSEIPDDEKKSILEQFEQGEVRLLTNVYILTEGFHFAKAHICILARGCQHASTYLQMVGRVLSSSPGKSNALVLDLPGLSHIFGLPTIERIYSLKNGIEWNKGVRVCMCHACGYVDKKPFSMCPRCKEMPLSDPRKQPKILGYKLARVYKGKDTPADAKKAELQKLLAIRRRGDYSYFWVAKKYQKLFGYLPDLGLTHAEKTREYKRYIAEAKLKGYKPGWAAVRFKETFGHWP